MLTLYNNAVHPYVTIVILLAYGKLHDRISLRLTHRHMFLSMGRTTINAFLGACGLALKAILHNQFMY